MKKTGSSFHFSESEKRILKKLVDKKYGKITTPVDYESSEYNEGLEGDVLTRTGEQVSGSTLERMVGLRSNENRAVRSSSLATMAKYLGFRGGSHLAAHVEQLTNFRRLRPKRMPVSGIFKNHLLRIDLGKGKAILIRFLDEGIFEVVQSTGTKFTGGDRLEVGQLEIGEELICLEVGRMMDQKLVQLGGYRSGSKNPVSGIEFVKS